MRDQQRARQRALLGAFFGMRLRTVALIGVVGFGGGAVGALYMWVLHTLTDAIGPDRWGPTSLIVFLVGVGAVVALIVAALGRPADVELLVGNIHVPGATEESDSRTESEERGGRLRSLIPVSLLCIAAGGTLGPEAPLVTTTGTLSARIARRAGLNEGDRRILAITGMAAGFSVLFGAPLGAAVFALEIPHRRGLEYYEALVPAVIGAVCGFVVSTAFGGLGLEPIWDLPMPGRVDGRDLLWAVGAGVLGALIGVFFIAAVGLLHRIVVLVPATVRPLVGGLALGLLALASPYALTNGEFQIDELARPVLIGTLVVAGLAKLIAAAVSVVTGWRGGFIIPLFFAGFVLGRAVAEWLSIDHEWLFVAGTMVAANVAVTKTPIGTTLVITDMSGFALGPTSIISALTCLVLTAPIGLIDSQSRRFDALGPASARRGPDPRSDADSSDHDDGDADQPPERRGGTDG